MLKQDCWESMLYKKLPSVLLSWESEGRFWLVARLFKFWISLQLFGWSDFACVVMAVVCGLKCWNLTSNTLQQCISLYGKCMQFVIQDYSPHNKRCAMLRKWYFHPYEKMMTKKCSCTVWHPWDKSLHALDVTSTNLLTTLPSSTGEQITHHKEWCR